jgi:hypothetical protein
MYVGLYKSLITLLVVCIILPGCKNPPRKVVTKSGMELQLPKCEEYVSKYSDVSLRADILNKYQGEIKLAAGTKTQLENLQQDYVLQAQRLCANAEFYISTGQEQQYFCSDERLSNSLTQLRMLNGVLEGIHDIEVAKSKASTVNRLLDDFMERFFTQFGTPCSEPPKPLSIEQVREVVKEELREFTELLRMAAPTLSSYLTTQEITLELENMHDELTNLSRRAEREYAEGDKYYREGDFGLRRKGHQGSVRPFRPAVTGVSKPSATIVSPRSGK